MRKCFALLFLIVAISLPVTAQYKILPQNYDWSKTTLIQDEAPKLKNPNTAMWISVGSTVGTYLLFIASSGAEEPSPLFITSLSIAMLAAPALGYLYTDNWDDFWNSVSIRFGGRLIMGGGALLYLAGALDGFLTGNPANEFLVGAGIIVMLGGAALNSVVTIRDFRRVRARVHEYNESMVQSVQVMPVVDPLNNVYGAGVRVNF